jgi:hypothetical protein
LGCVCVSSGVLLEVSYYQGGCSGLGFKGSSRRYDT